MLIFEINFRFSQGSLFTRSNRICCLFFFFLFLGFCLSPKLSTEYMQRRMPFLLVVKRGANNGWLLVIACYIFCFTMHLSVYVLVNISRLVCKSILRKVNKSACMAKSGLKIGQFSWTSYVYHS